MSKKDGQKYECHLPLVDQVKVTNEGIERRAKLKKPDEYLEPLKDKCLYFVRDTHLLLSIYLSC